MGTPPAPPYATIFFALYENEIVPHWILEGLCFLLQKLIDDVIGFWTADDDATQNDILWREFEADMNKFHGLKQLICEKPSHSVNFMDLTISIVDGRIETKLFEKALNLYLYLPPHSSHPHGVFTGLISGQILRIPRLCTHKYDADCSIRDFLDRLLERGHTQESLAPLFVIASAENNAKAFLQRSHTDRAQLKQQK